VGHECHRRRRLIGGQRRHRQRLGQHSQYVIAQQRKLRSRGGKGDERPRAGGRGGAKARGGGQAAREGLQRRNVNSLPKHQPAPLPGCIIVESRYSVVMPLPRYVAISMAILATAGCKNRSAEFKPPPDARRPVLKTEVELAAERDERIRSG